MADDGIYSAYFIDQKRNGRYNLKVCIKFVFNVKMSHQS